MQQNGTPEESYALGYYFKDEKNFLLLQIVMKQLQEQVSKMPNTSTPYSLKMAMDEKRIFPRLLYGISAPQIKVTKKRKQSCNRV